MGILIVQVTLGSVALACIIAVAYFGYCGLFNKRP